MKTRLTDKRLTDKILKLKPFERNQQLIKKGQTRKHMHGHCVQRWKNV